MKIFIKSVFAGILISLGCIIYSLCSDKIMGSFLFSFGLFTIVNLQLNLYTGKIGYLVNNFNKEYLNELSITLLGNLIGTCIMGFLVRFTRIDLYSYLITITDIKLNDTYLSILILAMFCGLLMYLGVELHRVIEYSIGKALSIIFVVMIFILSGFEHCIANMFYFVYTLNFDLVRFILMVLGNSLGAILGAYALKVIREK